MRRRWKVSSAQRADIWNRWKAGQSLNAIGRALGKDQHVIHFLLARHGGIVPRVRHRSRRVLTLGEREDISRGIAGGCSLRVIAQRLRRVSSTVSREVGRHGGRAQYRASDADQRARQLARAGQYWRVDNVRSFDEFLKRKFPESRRKAYYLMAIHEQLPRIHKVELQQVGWAKATELAKVARRDGQRLDSATWLH
jgi:IS30 family transposase